MWIILSFCSAFFAGITSILAKCGIRKTDSNVATAVRTIIVLIFSWAMVFIAGSFNNIYLLSTKTIIFLVLSGIATGASWLCYFRALQIGNVNRVVPVDKFGTVLTILLSIAFLNEKITIIKAAAIIIISIGTYLMAYDKKIIVKDEPKNKMWLVYAVMSAFFGALTAILGKLGIEGVESNLGTAIRTCVVLIMAWLVVIVSGKTKAAFQISKKELIFICLSGIATGASWLCYFRALQDGYAGVVVPIDKLSIVVTIIFSYFVFGERLSRKSLLGLFLIICGTFMMLI